eukprot:3366568-Heterocapsa_arctica.AAC.1
MKTLWCVMAGLHNKYINTLLASVIAGHFQKLSCRCCRCFSSSVGSPAARAATPASVIAWAVYHLRGGNDTP